MPGGVALQALGGLLRVFDARRGCGRLGLVRGEGVEGLGVGREGLRVAFRKEPAELERLWRCFMREVDPKIQ